MANTTQSYESVSLLVVIVNYRTAHLTIDCLRSLESEVRSAEGSSASLSLPKTHVVVTDNASGDGSVEQIQAAINTEGWGDWVSLMPLERNGGFAYGNNAAIAPALQSNNPPSYVLLLNPDTVVHSSALSTLVDFMNVHPEVGIAGSRLEEPDGTPQRSAFRFPTVFSEFDTALCLGMVSKLLSKWVIAPPVPEETCQTEWVAGASMIIRREVFNCVGLLDEKYFMYFEEVDFCLKANKSGWTCWYVPESRVIHLVGQSSGVTDTKRPPKRLPQYWFDSRRRYFLKNHGFLYTLTTDAAWMMGFILSNWRHVTRRKLRKNPPKLFSDFLFNSVFFKGVQL